MITRMRLTVMTLGIGLVAGAAACAGDTRTSADTAAPVAAAADTAPAPANTGMMGQMQSHMKMMESASADSLRAMMPMHRQMAGDMLAQMDRDMKSMNMQADAAWTATMDSVRQDLTRLSDMTAAQVAEFMPGHRRRMARLMESHQGMMGNMKM